MHSVNRQERESDKLNDSMEENGLIQNEIEEEKLPLTQKNTQQHDKEPLPLSKQEDHQK